MGDIKNEDKESIEELEKYENNSWKTVRNTLIILGVSFTIICSYFIYTSGTTKYDPNGVEIIDEHSQRNVFAKYLLRSYDELKIYQKVLKHKQIYTKYKRETTN